MDEIKNKYDEGKPSTYFEEQADKEWEIILILQQLEEAFRAEYGV